MWRDETTEIGSNAANGISYSMCQSIHSSGFNAPWRTPISR
jgi:hypothetical protein